MLVHSGAGGVGPAVIQATGILGVGSEGKMEYMKLSAFLEVKLFNTRNKYFVHLRRAAEIKVLK